MSVWGSGLVFNPDYEEADGSYFYGAAGTFGTTSAASSSSSSSSSSSTPAFPEPSLAGLSGPRPGQRPSYPVPRARVSNYAKPAPNYAAIAHRAMTKEDVEVARNEQLQQEQLARDKEQQAKQKFLLRSQPVPQSVCHFFQIGTCKYGKSCRFAHSILQDEPQEYGEYGEYEEYGGEGANGYGECGEGTSMGMSAGVLSAAGASYVYKGGAGAGPGTGAGAGAASSSSYSQGVPLRRGTDWSGPGLRSGSEELGDHDEASECGICMGDSPSDKLYGILSHCNCVFCLSCIREWRSDGATRNPGMAGSTVRQCPLCRVPSFFVVPSIRTFTLKSLVRVNANNADASSGNGLDDIQVRQDSLQDEKRVFIDTYKRSLQQKPCRNYLTDRSCPFGTSCFYLHIDANGEHERVPDLDITTKPRYLLNQAGETVIMQPSVPQEAFKLP